MFGKAIFTKILRNAVVILGSLFVGSKVTGITDIDGVVSYINRRVKVSNKTIIYSFTSLVFAFVGARKFRSKFE